MTTWDEKAEDYAVTHHTFEHQHQVWNDHGYFWFVQGARWQREALLSGRAVERAARAMTPQLWRMRDEGYESETHGQQVESSLLIARAVLAAALGEEEQ